MKLTAHQLHEMSYQFVSGARHRAASAWCDTAAFTSNAMFTIKPNTMHQRSQEPSPG